MKIDVDEERNIRLKEVFNSVVLETGEGVIFAICMRDNGYEFKYGEAWYEAKNNKVWMVAPHEKTITENNA